MWVVDCYALFVAAAGPLPRAARVFIGNMPTIQNDPLRASCLRAFTYIYFKD